MLEVAQYMFSDYTMELATKMNATARIEICRPMRYNQRLSSKSVQPESLIFLRTPKNQTSRKAALIKVLVKSAN